MPRVTPLVVTALTVLLLGGCGAADDAPPSLSDQTAGPGAEADGDDTGEADGEADDVEDDQGAAEDALGDLVAADDLREGPGDWATTTVAGRGAVAYESGGAILAPDGDTPAQLVAPYGLPVDETVVVETTFEPLVDATAAVGCRADSSGRNGYLARVDADGNYALVRRDDGEEEILLDGSDANLVTGDTLVLRVVCGVADAGEPIDLAMTVGASTLLPTEDPEAIGVAELQGVVLEARGGPVTFQTVAVSAAPPEDAG